jgi:glycosyltransferase involved in cell wall biosynthesis
MNISVLILTKNEQQDLPGCLESVRWSDDIHVYDSFSDDRTVELASSLGAKICQRPGQKSGLFGGGEAEHRNWGLKNISFKYQWVLQLDADERVTPDLAEHLIAATCRHTEYAAFRVRRRDFFMGRWLRHVQTSAFYVRLFRPELLRYDRLVNPVSIVDGEIGDVAGYLDHYPFSKGLEHWLGRHNLYSSLEAKQIIENQGLNLHFSLRKALFAKNFHERRRHQKELFYRLPFRPAVKFAILYFGKFGFLDGRAGFTYACLQSAYEYFIVLKVRELSKSKL